MHCKILKELADGLADILYILVYFVLLRAMPIPGDSRLLMGNNNNIKEIQIV